MTTQVRGALFEGVSRLGGSCQPLKCNSLNEPQALESMGPWPDVLSPICLSVPLPLVPKQWPLQWPHDPGVGPVSPVLGSIPRSLLQTLALSSGEAWVLMTGWGRGVGVALGLCTL